MKAVACSIVSRLYNVLPCAHLREEVLRLAKSQCKTLENGAGYAQGIVHEVARELFNVRQSLSGTILELLCILVLGCYMAKGDLFFWRTCCIHTYCLRADSQYNLTTGHQSWSGSSKFPLMSYKRSSLHPALLLTPWSFQPISTTQANFSTVPGEARLIFWL